MHSLVIQMEDLRCEEELEGKVFKLFEKTTNREFKQINNSTIHKRVIDIKMKLYGVA